MKLPGHFSCVYIPLALNLNSHKVNSFSHHIEYELKSFLASITRAEAAYPGK